MCITLGIMAVRKMRSKKEAQNNELQGAPDYPSKPVQQTGNGYGPGQGQGQVQGQYHQGQGQGSFQGQQPLQQGYATNGAGAPPSY